MALTLEVEALDAGRARLRWAVCDDGVGIGAPAQALDRGSGLAGIKQRLWALGAELGVASGPGGTRLEAVIEVAWTGGAHG